MILIRARPDCVQQALPFTVRRVESFADLVRSRRTHKSFGPDPVGPDVVDELLDLASWAPNHHRTNPWRFRVLGPESLARLKEAAGPAEAPKLERARTLVVATAVLSGDLLQDEEDVCATACAIYAVLLGAHARGLAGYWRTPRVLRTKAGREAIGLPDGERFVGLIHLGTPRGNPPAPERAPLESYRFFLP
jgi:nitroreductase